MMRAPGYLSVPVRTIRRSRSELNRLALGKSVHAHVQRCPARPASRGVGCDNRRAGVGSASVPEDAALDLRRCQRHAGQPLHCYAWLTPHSPIALLYACGAATLNHPRVDGRPFPNDAVLGIFCCRHLMELLFQHFVALDNVNVLGEVVLRPRLLALLLDHGRTLRARRGRR